jgi:hypothetical protein
MNEYSNIRKLIALILDSFHAYNHIKIHENDKLLHASKKKTGLCSPVPHNYCSCEMIFLPL